MHTKEEEAGHNHNHYRMRDNKPVRPEDFAEHMLALKSTEAFTAGFFQMGEIEEIIEDFNSHYRMWTYKGPDGTELSPEEIYMDLPQNKINEADVLEFNIFGEQQEPCRINVTELKMDFEKARKLIEERFLPKEVGTPITEEDAAAMRLEIAKLAAQFNALMDFRKIGGSRGLGAERAMTRQIEGSTLPEIPVVAAKDDSIGGTPVIPEWAKHALEQVELARRSIEDMAKSKSRKESEHAIINHSFFHPPLTVRQVYIKTPEILKSQLTQIFMRNKAPIELGDFRETVKALRMLYLEYHPDKHDGEVQPGFHELQNIIEQLRSSNTRASQEEILAILDRTESADIEEASTKTVTKPSI